VAGQTFPGWGGDREHLVLRLDALRRRLVSTRTIRVLVVDDHLLFAEALMLTLQGEGGLEIVAHAKDGVEAVELAGWLRPDVVLMDLDMPVMDGIEATRRIQRAQPAVQVIVVTALQASEDAARAREAGAVRFLPKGASTDELIAAIHDVATPVIPIRAAKTKTKTKPHHGGEAVSF
jgi:DNA-binding NarL/FixJ family response regulator